MKLWNDAKGLESIESEQLNALNPYKNDSSLSQTTTKSVDDTRGEIDWLVNLEVMSAPIDGVIKVMKIHGTDENKSFGFITRTDGGKDVFFTCNDLEGWLDTFNTIYKRVEKGEQVNISFIIGSQNSIKVLTSETLNNENVVYARTVLSQDQFDAIWEKWIWSEGMTPEKLGVLGNSDLSIEQIRAIWGEFLSHKGMTDQKITVIGYMLWVEDIERVWAKELAEMSMNELNALV